MASDQDYLIVSVTLAVVLLWQFRGFFTFLWQYVFRPDVDLAKYGSNTGVSWALVTGATAGLGRGFCEALAGEGFNIVLHGRNVPILEEIASSIREKHQVDTRIIVADLTEENVANDELYDMFWDRVFNLDLSIIVNNVGIRTPLPEELSMNKSEEIRKIIAINTTFPTLLTRKLIPVLRSRVSEDDYEARSAIINVSSVAKDYSAALHAVYAATKAYNNTFSRSIAAELWPVGIDVISITPGKVISKSNPDTAETIWNISPKTNAEASLDKLGVAYTITPHWAHRIQQLFFRFLPEKINGDFMRRMKQDEQERGLSSLAVEDNTTP